MPITPEPPESGQSPKQQAEQPIFKIPGGGKSGDRNTAMQEVGPYLTLGFQLAMFTGLGALAGWYLDKDTGSSLWTGILSAVGAIAGLVYFLRAVMKLSNKKTDKKP